MLPIIRPQTGVGADPGRVWGEEEWSYLLQVGQSALAGP